VLARGLSTKFGEKMMNEEEDKKRNEKGKGKIEEMKKEKEK
jgi:hypothetical protein